MKISLIRHGDARYDNLKHDTSFDTVGDLKIDGIEKLQEQAKIFADKIGPDEIVTIWSSPIPRAIETANIFTDEFSRQDISIRKQKLFAIFEEARGFRWEYLRGMVIGGNTNIHENVVMLDSSITNPKGLSFGQYFRQSAWKDIPTEYLQSLGDIGGILSNIETFSSITKRIFRQLERLSMAKIGAKNHILIFTHQCNTDFLTELLNEYQYGGVGTGENITLQTHDMDFDIIDFPQEISNVANTERVAVRTREKFRDIL